MVNLHLPWLKRSKVDAMGQLPIIVEFEEQTSPDLYARIEKVFMDIVHEEQKNMIGGMDKDA